MAIPPENIQRTFRLYVTHVDGESLFLKISGQLDQQSSLMIESLFKTAAESLEQGIGVIPPAAIHEGLVCAAKYKDGVYYRAKITNISNLANGLVGVHFIDYGNKDTISLSTIRSLDNYDPMFLQLRGQATDYYLSRIMHPAGRWDEALLLKLQSLLCYAEYTATIDAFTRSLPIISIQFKGNDLSTHLLANKFGLSIPVAKQEVVILQLADTPPNSNWSPTMITEPPTYPEHVPFLINQNFPNAALAMRQNVSMVPYSTAQPSVGQRLLVNRAARNTVNLRAPVRQPQQAQARISDIVSASPSPPIQSKGPSSPKKSYTYKSRLLEINTTYTVLVSYAEEGPELFAVQIASDGKKLQEMMDNINRRPHSSLTEPPMIGTVCLGRMSADRIICRAVVVNLSGSQCKLFFVDFGDTEMVSYYDIFDIPEEFVKPNVYAMRFRLSGVRSLPKGPHLNEAFKQLVNGKILTLKVVPPEGPPLIQYGELYIDNANVLDLLLANMKDNLQFKWMDVLPQNSKHSVLVSYVDSCIKFYVQLSDKIDELNAVMDAVKRHCENTSSPGALPIGSVCCARFPEDDNWYRGMVRDVKGDKIVVAYVDYGNEQEVDVADIRTITPDLIQLPAQAIKCALKGFEDKPVESKTSNLLEMLALEKTFLATVVGMFSHDTMLVTLVDDTVSPPLDIARRMTQLSQPRSTGNTENKPTTPVRKEPETFSSPESVTDDRKKNYRREKSFKDERRPREDREEFGQRPGSFRGRDQKDNLDRSGPGRHSDKFNKPKPQERRGGRRDGPFSPPPAVEDSWEEPTSSQPPLRQNRDNKKKSRPDEKSAHKKDIRRVRAAETQTKSVQDRLKRDRFNHQDGENNFEDRNNRYQRPDRRDRGERRDNWGDKKENWNQKRDFNNREERGDRGDRDRGDRGDRDRGDRGDRDRGERFGKSNFTPRDRAERSFGSDSDKRSERSNKFDSGRPPYKNRKFTQPKELENPVPLDTPFNEQTIEVGSQHEVSVTWIISPENFYTQILTLQPKFIEMMHKIPTLYKGVKAYTGEITIGASVLARYPVDGVLYRATVVAIQPFSKFIVQYIDFGNKQLVDAKDIWQLDSELMDLPKMAVHCSLLGVKPVESEWKTSPELDLCFNAPRYQCIFQESVESVFKVSLWNNGASVADLLVEKGFAQPADNVASVTLKDEAIDLTIIVGQEILCRVTHVESYDKFYIQLDLDKASTVENAIDSYDTNKLVPMPQQNLIEGVHCLIRHENKLYRAILNSIQDTITAVLPDYGNTVQTTADNVMMLPTELSVYYYQSLECGLNNYSPESTILLNPEEFKTKLTGNKFIIFINDVDGIRLITTLYDPKTGQKLAIFEPDEGAYNEVIPLSARAVFNYNFGLAYISHIESLTEIYLQKSTDSDKIAVFLDELYKFYEEGTPEPLESFEESGLCVAKSSDGNWYRATITSSTDTEVKVKFTDYGNTETVSKEVVKKLDPKFYEPCSFALVASLGLAALQEDAISKLQEWTNEKEIQVTLAFGDDGWLANLNLDGVDLAIKLVNEKLAGKPSEETQVKEEIPAEPVSLPEGCAQVYISHIDSPGQFWLQMADKVDKIEGIQAELQANVENYPEIENRELGTLCVAKFSADDLWYRAEILDSDADITTVRFIDYGNTDVLDNQPGLIKVLPEHLKGIEGYAVKASVNAIPTGTGQWSEPASDYFTELVGDLTLPVDALVVLKDVTTYVDIFVNGQNITDKLVSEGHASRSEENECGDLPLCYASHVNSPSEFWIQLESATPELQAMEELMADAANFPPLESKEEGIICAAEYPEDGAWYRAQVIVDGSEGTEVLFMDYGNASIVKELRSLPDDLKTKPALSRKCALQKPRDIKTWSRQSEVKFNELAAEGATIFNVQFIASGDISIVELFLEGKSVTEQLVGLCEELAERPTPVGQDLHSKGKVCYVNSLNEFYVQLDDSGSNLDKVTDILTKGEELEPATALKVGSLCAAFWADDEQWYRAKILEFCDVGYHVQFIDYGNKAKCEEFRQLPDELISIESLAKCCRLSGITEEMANNESAKSKLEDLVAELTTFDIEFLDSLTEPYLVKLLLNGTDIASVLFSEDTSESQQEKIEQEVKEPVKCNDETTTINEALEIVNELDPSQVDLNESMDSAKTVIEKSFIENVEDKSPTEVEKHNSLEKDQTNTEENKSNETIQDKSDVSIVEKDAEENKSNEMLNISDETAVKKDKDAEKDTKDLEDTKIPEKNTESEKEQLESPVKQVEKADEVIVNNTIATE